MADPDPSWEGRVEALWRDAPSLHDEARATLALTYVAQDRPVEAAGPALSALAPHLSRYNRSVAANAAELVARTSTP